MTRWIVCVVVSFFCVFAWAQDKTQAPDKESSSKEFFVQDGVAHQLEAGGKKFLVIYKAASSVKKQGGILLVHDHGATVDTEAVINPLRRALPEYGWDTLSVSMPEDVAVTDLKSDKSGEKSPDKNADAVPPLSKELKERINAGIEFLEKQDAKKIVLLGEGESAVDVARFLVEEKSKSVRGLVLVSLNTDGKYFDESVLPELAKARLNILDMYGSMDLDPVLATTKARNIAATQLRRFNYMQREVDGAQHNFIGYEEQLVRRLRFWLKYL